MGGVASLRPKAMASRWRRRQPCILAADHPNVAVIRRITASSAVVDTAARPPLGSRVTIHHPEAGAIEGTISGHLNDGLGIAFEDPVRAVAFALASLATDSSRP